MWVRGLVLVALVGGCYSPSITTCALACAANNVCPDGFECSAGMCAARGTTCQGGGTEDAMPLPDGSSAQCGDSAAFVGEICFKQPPVTITTGASGIYDAQFIDVNADGKRDVVHLGPLGYVFRYNDGSGVFSGNPVAGPPSGMTQRMRGVNLDNPATSPELINATTAGQIQIWTWNGVDQFMLAAAAASGPIEIAGIAVARVKASSGPSDLAFLYQDQMRVYSLVAGGGLTVSAFPGSPFPVAGGRDIAVGDFDNNSIGEISLATSAGIDVYRYIQSVLMKVASPNIMEGVAAVGAGDVDGDSDGDLFYLITAPSGQDGKIGVAHWNGTGWDLSPTKLVTNLFGQLDVADVDQDGKADAIAAKSVGPQVSVIILRGRADGGLEDPVEIPIPTPVTQLRANADFNGDGYVDIAITASAMGKIVILESNP